MSRSDRYAPMWAATAEPVKGCRLHVLRRSHQWVMGSANGSGAGRWVPKADNKVASQYGDKYCSAKLRITRAQSVQCQRAVTRPPADIAPWGHCPPRLVRPKWVMADLPVCNAQLLGSLCVWGVQGKSGGGSRRLL